MIEVKERIIVCSKNTKKELKEMNTNNYFPFNLPENFTAADLNDFLEMIGKGFGIITGFYFEIKGFKFWPEQDNIFNYKFSSLLLQDGIFDYKFKGSLLLKEFK